MVSQNHHHSLKGHLLKLQTFLPLAHLELTMKWLRFFEVLLLLGPRDTPGSHSTILHLP